MALENRKRLKIAIIMLLLMGLGLGVNHWYRLPKYHSGDIALPFSATLADGKAFALRDLEGQYVLLDFWGSWCGPCRKENPALVRLYQKFNKQSFKDASGFEIVSIAVETKEDKWRKAIQDDNLYWPYHIGELQRFSSPTVQLYGVREIPTKYLISPQGKIIMVNPSFETLNDFLQNQLATDK